MSTERPRALAGILLTGGASRRMGVTKASIVVDGTSLAVRTAALLAAVADPVIEIGPGYSGLEARMERTPGEGPLVAVAAGAAALAEAGWHGPALVLACDLPLLTAAALDLIGRWPGEGGAVPVVAGHRQPLCARWSAEDLSDARRLAGSGQRSLRGLPRVVPGSVVDEDAWGGACGPEVFADVDAPADLTRLGLRV
jgi:molybdopterin-guanine dinucleotide biosynthesis protein A